MVSPRLLQQSWGWLFWFTILAKGLPILYDIQVQALKRSRQGINIFIKIIFHLFFAISSPIMYKVLISSGRGYLGRTERAFKRNNNLIFKLITRAKLLTGIWGKKVRPFLLRWILLDTFRHLGSNTLFKRFSKWEFNSEGSSKSLIAWRPVIRSISYALRWSVLSFLQKKYCRR